MLRKIINRLKMEWFFLANPLCRDAATEMGKTLSDETQGLGKNTSKKYRQRLAREVLRSVAEVVFSDDQVRANREKLTEAVLAMVKYQVLIISSPDEEPVDTTGLRGKPGITSELKSHIKEIAERDEEIKAFMQGQDDWTDKDIYELCLLRSWTIIVVANTFHMLRIRLKDISPNLENDWYRPFVAAMCAWQEHEYRELIGLPTVLSGIEALKYSTFMNMVLDGAANPYLEWQETFGDTE